MALAGLSAAGEPRAQSRDRRPAGARGPAFRDLPQFRASPRTEGKDQTVSSSWSLSARSGRGPSQRYLLSRCLARLIARRSDQVAPTRPPDLNQPPMPRCLARQHRRQSHLHKMEPSPMRLTICELAPDEGDETPNAVFSDRRFPIAAALPQGLLDRSE